MFFSGVIKSENYPDNYPNNFNRNYTINAEDAFVITFSDFELEVRKYLEDIQFYSFIFRNTLTVPLIGL